MLLNLSIPGVHFPVSSTIIFLWKRKEKAYVGSVKEFAAIGVDYEEAANKLLLACLYQTSKQRPTASSLLDTLLSSCSIQLPSLIPYL